MKSQPLSAEQMAAAAAKPLTEQTPAEIDTQLFPLWIKAQDIRRDIRFITHDGWGRSRHPLTPAQAQAVAERREKLQEVDAKAETFQAEYRRRGGWSRVFHVLNGDGHTHSTTHCKTCRIDTRFGYRPELSGLSEDEIIAEIGETACTVCYPNAPLSPRYQEAMQRSAAEKEAAAAAKQAEKDKKAAEKEAKAISHPDGGKLYGIKTHREARIELVDQMWWKNLSQSYLTQEADATAERIEQIHRNIAEHQTKITRIAEALAHKEGIDITQVMAEASWRLNARNKRDKSR